MHDMTRAIHHASEAALPSGLNTMQDMTAAIHLEVGHTDSDVATKMQRITFPPQLLSRRPRACPPRCLPLLRPSLP